MTRRGVIVTTVMVTVTYHHLIEYITLAVMDSQLDSQRIFGACKDTEIFREPFGMPSLILQLLQSYHAQPRPYLRPERHVQYTCIL